MIDQKSGLEFQKFGNSTQNLIFFHGGFLGFTSYGPFLKALGEIFTVYAISLPGHGQSIDYFKDSDISNALKNFIQSLKLTNTTVIGHSFGAYSALLACQNQKAISKLVLVNPLIPPIASKTFKIARSFLFLLLKNLILNPFIIFVYVRALQDIFRNLVLKREKYLRTFKNIIQTLHKSFEFEEINANIQILLLSGKSDSVLPPEYFPKLQQFFPKLEFYKIKGSHDLGLSSFSEIIKILTINSPS